MSGAAPSRRSVRDVSAAKRPARVPRLLGAALVAAGLLGTTATVTAATSVPHFANCTNMHAAAHGAYRGGIARSGAKDKRPGGGHARYQPYVNTAYYNANKKMDRDGDGIACEQ